MWPLHFLGLVQLSPLCPLQWENHNKSLQLEAQTYQRIHEKIQERVMNNLGTWIDWQYLQNAAKLLAKVCASSEPRSDAWSVRPIPLRVGGTVGGRGSAPCAAPHASAHGSTVPRAGPGPLRTQPSAGCPEHFQEEYSAASACREGTAGKPEPFSSFVPSMRHSKENKRLSLDKY